MVMAYHLVKQMVLETLVECMYSPTLYHNYVENVTSFRHVSHELIYVLNKTCRTHILYFSLCRPVCTIYTY